MTPADPYAVYVIGAYAAAAVVLGAALWSTLGANARTRRELARRESEIPRNPKAPKTPESSKTPEPSKKPASKKTRPKKTAPKKDLEDRG